MKAAGYDVALLGFKDHEATGVAMPLSTTYGSYYNKNGKDYFYCETTGSGWKLGEVPKDYKGQDAHVVVI
jgi:hypothetical protein